MSIADDQPVVARLGCVARKPLPDRGLVEMDEDALPELLDRRQPVGVTRDRRAAYRELDILDLAVRGRRRRLEPREAVEA